MCYKLEVKKCTCKGISFVAAHKLSEAARTPPVPLIINCRKYGTLLYYCYEHCPQTADTIYTFEFKLSGNGSAEDAIKQIHEQQYAAQYKAEGKKIVLIGSSFDEQSRTIKDWKTEVL